MKKIKEIIKGISEGLTKTAPKCLYDCDRESYDWVYSEIVRVIRLLGGKECGTYRQDVYSMMSDTRRFLIKHNAAYRKCVDKGDISGDVVSDVDFAIGRDVNGKVYILFDYLFTPEGEHYLVKEIMHNQICLSNFEANYMRKTEDGVFHFLIRIIDDIYRKKYGKSRKESFWNDAKFESKCVELPVEEWHYDSNGTHHTFKYELTGRKSWFDEYYKNKEEKLFKKEV